MKKTLLNTMLQSTPAQKKLKMLSTFAVLFLSALTSSAQTFQLNADGYFNAGGTDVMVFSDFYPEGHQGGVCVIMNGHRIATNGDIRLEATPGQWQPVPKQLSRQVEGNRIRTTLCYPDSSRHLTGFNPMVYPDYQFTYVVTVEPQGKGIAVTVDLDKPVPDFLLGKVGFNLEFFPGELFGKPWTMDGQTGIYPQQPNSPLLTLPTNRGHDGNYFAGRGQKADLSQLDGKGYSPLRADDIIAAPYAEGRRFTSRPDDKSQKLTVMSLTGSLKLYDGRMNHNNGWFVLRSEIAKGATKGAVRWIITPEVDESWRYQPVIQTSQVGYLTNQQKHIVIETDQRDDTSADVQLVRIDSRGEQTVRTVQPAVWGRFLRYRYLTADFSDVTEPGLYQVRYKDSRSSVFRIDDNVYERGVWQPVIEYFLPVQMCHMRVSEKYRIWHDACHLDDALMAHVGNHIDGYDQRPGLSKYAEGQPVPGVNVGGWHDAGDFDLRVESQAGEAYILALAYEQFRPAIDVTAIDHQQHQVEIHEADGKNDILQQVENGALTVVRSYQALGRLYRGIICNSLRQYAMLGDAAAMTDGKPGNSDDRWIFTEDNPGRALTTAAQLAGAARVLQGFSDELGRECLSIATDIYQQTAANGSLMGAKLQAAAELYLATGEKTYLDFIFSQQELITKSIGRTGWFMARIAKQLEARKDKQSRRFVTAFRHALLSHNADLKERSAETPYGVPYRPSIWGAGWDIQRFGFEYYFLAAAYPDIFGKETVFRALDFVLGCHPGSNTDSFASGVGAQSATVAYGLNRADWSYIPGGVVSGTALIRPDFPELLTFPFLWQQTEYVLGGGSSHYMFLVLAAQALAKADTQFTLVNGDVSMTIDASKGGKILSMKYKDQEAISQSRWPESFGSTFWTSPQKEWNWPPVPEFDKMPYSVSKSKDGRLILKGQTSEKMGLSVGKEFSTDAKDGAFVVTYTIKNEGSEPRRVAPWEITRVINGDGLIFFEATDNRIWPEGLMNFEPVQGAMWYKTDETTENRKVNADGKGWLGYCADGLLLLKRFKDLKPNEAAPDEAEVQVYVNRGKSYIELESQGAYTQLKPGAQLRWTVRWYLTPVDTTAQQPEKLLQTVKDIFSGKKSRTAK